MKLIPLSNGGCAKVDDEDFDAINRWTWRQEWGYAVRGERPSGEKYRQIRMHRVILDAPTSIEVDHRNLDRLDNQRHNLRLSTATQQQANQGVSSGSTLGLKGVTSFGMHYIAKITANGRLTPLGHFRNPADAARAYDKAALRIFGDFARTNAMMHPERLRDWDLLMGFVERANQHRARKWHSYVSVKTLRRMAAKIAA